MSDNTVNPHSPDALAANPKAPMKRAFLSGSAWAFGGYGLRQVIRLAGNLLLTRLLFPEAFGLMALVNLFIQGLEMFADIGIGPSIIQHKRGGERVFLNTAWTLQVIRGFVLWGVCLILAPAAAFIYHQPALLYMMPVAGFSAVVSGFSSTALFTELRRLSLGRLTLLEVGSQAVGIALMAVWAWFQPTIWVLVGGTLLSALVRTIASHYLLPGESNRWHWDRTVAGELTRFGRWIFLSTALSFLASQGDRLILGRYLTMDMLGIYGIAMFLAQAALAALLSVSGKVLFPLYSRLTEADPAELRRRLWKYRLLLLGAVCPILIGTTVFGDIVIRILYDHRYQQAGWMLQILSVGTIGSVILVTLDPVLLAVGDSFGFMILQLGRSLLLPTAMAAGGWMGGHIDLPGVGLIGSLPGVIVGVAAAPFLVYPLLVWRVRPHGVWRPSFDAAVAAVCGILISLGFLVKPEICHWLSRIPHLYRS